MAGMLLSIALLVAVSVLMSLLAHGVRKWERVDESVVIALAVLIGIVVVGALSVIGVTLVLTGTFGNIGIMGLFLTLLIYFPPVAIAGVHLAGTLSSSTANGLFLSGLSSPAPSRYGKARKRAIEGDLDGALAEFWVYHRQNPKDPGPLLCAEAMFEKHGRFEEAASVWRDILRVYQENKAIWAEGALRLADLLEQHCDDPKAARYLLREIQRRAPNSEPGRLATTRLLQREKNVS